MKKKSFIILLTSLLVLFVLFVFHFVRIGDDVTVDDEIAGPVLEENNKILEDADVRSRLQLEDRIALNQENIVYGSVYDEICDEEHLLTDVDYYGISESNEILFNGKCSDNGTFEIKRKSFNGVSGLCFHKKGYLPKYVTDVNAHTVSMPVVLKRCGYMKLHLDSSETEYDGRAVIKITDVKTEIQMEDSFLLEAREFGKLFDEYAVSSLTDDAMDQDYKVYTYPLPLGIWKIRIALENGSSIESDDIATCHGETNYVHLQVHDFGVISGTCIDQIGNNIPDIEVRAYPADYISPNDEGYRIFRELRSAIDNQIIVAEPSVTKTDDRGEFEFDRLVKGVKYEVGIWDDWRYLNTGNIDLIEPDYDGLILECEKQPVMMLYIKNSSGSMLDVKNGSVFIEAGLNYENTIEENPCRLPLVKEDEDDCDDPMIVRAFVNNGFIGKIEFQKSPYQHDIVKEIVVDPIDPDNIYRLEHIPIDYHSVSLIESRKGSPRNHSWSCNKRISWCDLYYEIVLVKDLSESESATLYSKNSIAMIYLLSHHCRDCAYIDCSGSEGLIQCGKRRVRVVTNELESDRSEYTVVVVAYCPKYNKAVWSLNFRETNPDLWNREWPTDMIYKFIVRYRHREEKNFDKKFYLEEGDEEFLIVR